jgi:hypothetical protein
MWCAKKWKCEMKLTDGKNWRAQGDDLRTFLGDFVAALPQIEFPAGLNL